MDKLLIITSDLKRGEEWATSHGYNRKEYKVASTISAIQGAKDCKYILLPPSPKDMWKFTNYINKHNLTKLKVENEK